MRVHCTRCKIKFNRPKSQCEKSRNLFCTRTCSAIFNNTHNPRRTKTLHPCKKCNIPIVLRKTYCSIQCDPNRVDWATKTLGELRQRKSNNMHVCIRSNARHVYKKSQRPKRCAVCKYDKHFEVCHIKALETFSDAAKMTVVNASSNLVALCPTHHWELDHDLLSKRDQKLLTK